MVFMGNTLQLFSTMRHGGGSERSLSAASLADSKDAMVNDKEAFSDGNITYSTDQRSQTFLKQGPLLSTSAGSGTRLGWFAAEPDPRGKLRSKSRSPRPSLGIAASKARSKSLSPRSSSTAKKKVSASKTVQVFEDEDSANTLAAAALMEQIHKPKISKEGFAALWINPRKAKWIMEDGYSVRGSQGILEALSELRQSFPDYKFAYQSIRVGPKHNSIIIDGVHLMGTHTGRPFGPLGHPVVPATGQTVSNDEECFFLEMEHGKIKTWQLVGMGIRTGLMGFCEGIGGCSASALPSSSPPTGGANPVASKDSQDLIAACHGCNSNSQSK